MTQGFEALSKRLAALGHEEPVLEALQLAVVHEAQALVPRKTGFLQRNIAPGFIRGSSATVEARTPYARFVEEGTGLYGPKKKKIVPKTKKALAWKSGGKSKVRLTGRSRTRGGKAIADTSFAASVKGRRATPYLKPGAEKAIRKSGLKDVVVKLWNDAA